MPRKPKGHPSTGVTVPARAGGVDAERVEQAVLWLLEGARDAEILRSIAEHWPDQATEPLLLAVAEKLAESAIVEPDVVRGFCIEATRGVYQKMLAVGDLVGALRAIKQLGELAG